MKLSTWLLVALAGAFTALSPDASAKVREDFERVIPFSAGGSFEIQNSNGSIHVKTWSEDTVRIVAEKEAKSQDGLDDIEIVIDGSGDSVSVETVHRRRNNRGKVNYVISMPADANVNVTTANGSVTIRGIHGHVIGHRAPVQTRGVPARTPPLMSLWASRRRSLHGRLCFPLKLQERYPSRRTRCEHQALTNITPYQP